MSKSRDYRSEAQAARQAARQTLLAYREARKRTKRNTGKGMEPGPSVADRSTTDEAVITPASFFSMPADPPAEEIAASDGSVEENSADASSALEGENLDSEVPTDSNPLAAKSGDDESGEELNGVEVSETHDLLSTEASNSPDSTPTEAADAHRGPEASATLESAPRMPTIDPGTDLFELPGAGAGMVWMFHQCEIKSLADLACADQHVLSRKLGVVGHILNVEPWIAFARERTGSDASVQRA